MALKDFTLEQLRHFLKLADQKALESVSTLYPDAGAPAASLTFVTLSNKYFKQYIGDDD